MCSAVTTAPTPGVTSAPTIAQTVGEPYDATEDEISHIIEHDTNAPTANPTHDLYLDGGDVFVVETAFTFSGYTTDTFTDDETESLKEAVAQYLSGSDAISGSQGITTDQITIGTPEPSNNRRVRRALADAVEISISINSGDSDLTDEVASALAAMNNNGGESGRFGTLMQSELSKRGRNLPENAMLPSTANDVASFVLDENMYKTKRKSNYGDTDTSITADSGDGSNSDDSNSGSTVSPEIAESNSGMADVIGAGVGATVCALALIFVAHRSLKTAKREEPSAIQMSEGEGSGLPAVPDVL